MSTIKYVSKDDGVNFEVNWGKGEAWWEGTSFLAKTIKAVTLKLAENPSGAPIELYMNAIKNLGGNPDDVFGGDIDSDMGQKATDASVAEWVNILKRMSEAFEVEDGLQPTQEQIDGRLLFIQYFDYLWD